jgi:hypothetical protein
MPALTENQAIEALRAVQGMTPEQFEKALHDEVGRPVLAVMNALARRLNPNDDDDAIAQGKRNDDAVTKLLDKARQLEREGKIRAE